MKHQVPSALAACAAALAPLLEVQTMTEVVAPFFASAKDRVREIPTEVLLRLLRSSRAEILAAGWDFQGVTDRRVLSLLWGAHAAELALDSLASQQQKDAASSQIQRPQLLSSLSSSLSLSQAPEVWYSPEEVEAMLSFAMAALEGRFVTRVSGFALPRRAATGSDSAADGSQIAAHQFHQQLSNSSLAPGGGAVHGPRRSELVVTATTALNLHALTLAVARGEPVIIEGAVGSGKSCLLDELALRTGNAADLIRVLVGDQLDSKDLLGSYVCTDVPGEFRWQPGVLTQAVAEGRWIVFEDIDLAPFDILSVLVPLLQSRTLFLPSRGESMPAAPGFRFFSTRTPLAGEGTHLQDSVKMVVELMTRVRLRPLTRDDLVQVISGRFPRLQQPERYVDVFLEGGAAREELARASRGRIASTRDLVKWCSRVAARDPVMVTAALVFREALECFCDMAPPTDPSRLAWARKLAERVGLSLPEASDALGPSYRPAFTVTTQAVIAGRTQLPFQHAHISKDSGAGFTLTVPAAQLLEKIASAVVSHEPVLLVGETGTGKTSVVQYLNIHILI